MTSWLATGPPVMCWVAPARVVTSWPAEKFCVIDRKSTRLNSSHSQISYAVFCLKKKRSIPSSRIYPFAYFSNTNDIYVLQRVRVDHPHLTSIHARDVYNVPVCRLRRPLQQGDA